RCRQLVPDLDLVAVRVMADEVGLAGAEFALLGHRAAGRFHGGRGDVDVCWVDETEAEVDDATLAAGALLVLLEHQHVAAPRRLQLHETVALVNDYRAEDGAVEVSGALEVAHRDGGVGEPVGLDGHGLAMSGRRFTTSASS